MRKLSIVLALVAGFFATQARADVTGKDASASTITWFDFICFTTKHCPGHVNINSAGTEVGTSGAPLRFDPTGTTTQPVSLASVPSHAVTNAGTFATQSAVTAASGSFASGSIASGAMAAGSHATGSAVDGWDLTQGAIADAAVTAGATGSVSAKLRAISRDIGTLTTLFNANGRATSANSSPTVQAPAPSTWHLVSAASTNATSVKASAATVFSCQLGNIDAAVAFLKIYNKASSPTVGTDTPVKTLIIPKAGTAADGAGSNVSFGPGGLTLGTGFAAAVTAGLPVADTTAVAASKVIINCDYE